MNESADLDRHIEDFRLQTDKVVKKISGVGDIWKDSNYSSLEKQMGKLARASKSVIKNGRSASKCVDNFFIIANEKF